jgi:hypothetical protein
LIADRCRHEVHRTGAAVLAIPPAVAVLTAAVIMVARDSAAASRVVPGALETLLPLAAGVAAVSAIGRDSARELLLSLPARYRAVLGWRVGLVLAAVAGSGGILTAAVVGAGAWPASPGMLAAQLVWLAPAAFLAGLGAAVCMMAGSGGLGIAAVGVLWLAELSEPTLFVGRAWQSLFLFANGRVPAAPFHSTAGATEAWWHDRISLCLAALALAGLAIGLTRNRDRLLRSMS